MFIDSAVIPHHAVESIPFHELMELIKINPKYLNEKKTWYRIEKKLQYFKVRDDLRIFTELFFQKFASETLKLDTLIYNLAYIRDKDPKTQLISSKSTLGLLSQNFQTPGNNYFLASELLNSECSDLCQYGGFSLVTMLNFFKDYVAPQEYEIIKDFLIRLFIIDGLLLQFDRNPHNIGFEIPAISDLSHTKRLRPQILVREKVTSDRLLENVDGVLKLTGIKPSKVYDSERILNIDHNNVFLHNPQSIWTPVFPFKECLGFRTQDDAKKASKASYDGLDPNLTELYMTFYEESKKYFEQLAHDDIYRRILEDFSKPNDPVSLQPAEREKIEKTIIRRQKEFKKILRLG